MTRRPYGFRVFDFTNRFQTTTVLEHQVVGNIPRIAFAEETFEL